MTGHIGLGAPGDEREYILRDPKGFDRSAANPFAARVNTNEKYGDLEGWSEEVWENWQTGITREPDEGGTFYSEVETRFRNKVFLPYGTGLTGLNAYADSFAWIRTEGASGTFGDKPWLLTNHWFDDNQPGFELFPITLVVPVGSTQTREKIGQGVSAYTWDTGDKIRGIWLLLQNTTYSVTVDLRQWSNATSAEGTTSETPGTLEATASMVPDCGVPGYHWYYFAFSTAWTLDGATDTDDLFIVIYPTSAGQTIYVPTSTWTYPLLGDVYWNDTNAEWRYGQGNEPNYSELAPNGYANDAGTVYGECPLYMIDVDHQWMGTPDTDTVVDAIIRFGSNVYAAAEDRLYYKWNGDQTPEPAQEDWWPFCWYKVGSARSADITSLEVWDGNLWIGLGNSTNLDTMNSAHTYTGGSVAANLLYRFGGYLYRSVANDLYYTSDGSTWSGPFTFGDDNYEIRGMAGSDGRLYVATDEGLWYLAPGDFPTGLKRWDNIDSRNGKGMITGDDLSIYIPLVTQVLRFDQYGSMNDIWMEYSEGVPATRLGPVKGLFSLYGQVCAMVDPPDTTSNVNPPTLWTFNGQGWHHVATLHPRNALSCSFYDYQSDRIWIGTERGYVEQVYLPDTAVNPLVAANSYYRPGGWFEYDKFYGGYADLYKDFESVFISGVDFGTGTASYSWDTGEVVHREMDVYWKDEASTAWELLGTVDSDMQELRWSDYTTRPASRWIKLGFLFRCGDVVTTPQVEVVRLKFHVNVNDRFSWPMDIVVSDNQAMLDGTKNTQTGAQMLTHLDSLSKQTPPVIFRDTDGTRYECKVTTHRRRILEYDWKPQSAAAQVTYVYSLVLDQVNTDTYTP